MYAASGILVLCMWPSCAHAKGRLQSPLSKCTRWPTCRGKIHILTFYIEHKTHRQITFVYIILLYDTHSDSPTQCYTTTHSCLYDTLIVQHRAIQPHIVVCMTHSDSPTQCYTTTHSCFLFNKMITYSKYNKAIIHFYRMRIPEAAYVYN